MPDYSLNPMAMDDGFALRQARDEIERLRAELARIRGLPRLAALDDENARLRAALKATADRITKIAFDIPAPNTHTPELIMLADSIRWHGHEQKTSHRREGSHPADQ